MPSADDDIIYPIKHVGPVPKRFQLDEDRLIRYLRNNVEIFPSKGELKIQKFLFGQSNPTYLLTINKQRFVLRKKPPGKLLPSAHAIEREYMVMNALQNTFVPVPRMYCLCTDSSVIGTPFYVCEFINGRVLRNPALPGFSKSDRFSIYSELNSVLARIHSLNIHELNLTRYAKIRDRDSNNSPLYGNYIKRLITRWSKQYESARYPETDNPDVQRFMNQMRHYTRQDYISDELEPNCLIHGDFRLDNVIFHPTKNKILAVVDWELSTIGHPLTDLSIPSMAYFFPPKTKSTTPGGSSLGLAGLNLSKLGIPSELEFVQAYIRNISFKSDLIRKFKFPIKDWNYYLGICVFRYIGIFQGIYGRIQQGNASNPHMTTQKFNMFLNFLCDTGLSLLKRKDIFDQLLYENLTKEQRYRLPKYLEPFRSQFSEDFYRHRANLIYFDEAYIHPIEKQYELFYESNPKNKWKIFPQFEYLKNTTKRLKLWNLFLPKEYPEGAGLSNIEYAPLCEIMGKHGHLTPEACNCAAPDTGNMEVLAKYGNDYQKKRFLQPLLEGKVRSCFAMTEPKVASSDARNIETSMVKTNDGKYYIVNGRKWWTSGAMDVRCSICILMGKTDPKAPTYFQQSMFAIPMNLPGIKIVRHLKVFGYDDNPHGHAEVVFDNVKVPKECLLLGEGRGFEIAQGRLGPGRIHHCMRSIGVAERALNIMKRRVLTRYTFGTKTANHTNIRHDIANSRMEIEQSRLLTLQTASMMDKIGNLKARQYISMIKVVAPVTCLKVVDRAIQSAGGLGVCQDTPLARMYAGMRALRIADGPDDVHLMVTARMELLRSKL